MKKNSIYYYDKPAIYRPTKNELHSGFFYCPNCNGLLSKPRVRIIKRIFICPSCGFKIEHEKVLIDQRTIDDYKKRKQQIVDDVIGV